MKTSEPMPIPIAAPARKAWRPALALAGLILVTAAFAQPLFALGSMAKSSDLFSYILLIPVATAYLIYLRAPILPRADRSSWPLGGLCVLLAAAAWWGTPPAPASAVDRLAGQISAYYLLLLAVGFFCLGRKWMRASAFPVFFLAFLIPLPDAVVAALELASQTASAWAAEQAFALTGMPVFRQGFVFDLAGARVQVAQECSGLRSSVALFLSGLLASNLILRAPLHRAALLAMIIPIAVVRNGTRIWLIAWLCVQYGPQMIHSIYHTHGGPAFFVLSLVPLLGLLWWFTRREERALAADRPPPPPSSSLSS